MCTYTVCTVNIVPIWSICKCVSLEIKLHNMLIYVDIVFVCVCECVKLHGIRGLWLSVPCRRHPNIVGVLEKFPLMVLITFPDYPPMWVYNLYKPFFPMAHMSMGWLKGKSTGNHIFFHQIWDFRVIFPLKQWIEYDKVYSIWQDQIWPSIPGRERKHGMSHW